MKSLLITILVIFAFPLLVHASGAKPSGKPLPPMQVSITPAHESFSPEYARPGETVELKVTITTRSGLDKVDMNISFAGGVELVSGEAGWSGPVTKNTPLTLLITVRIPESGKGKVTAHASVQSPEGTVFKISGTYRLGKEDKKEDKSEPPVKKDSTGQEIIEYKVK